MKKIIYLAMVLVLALSLLAVPAFASDSVNVTVTADKTEVQPGDTITYTVAVNNTTGSGIAGLTIDVNASDDLEYVSSEVPCSGWFYLAKYFESGEYFTATGTDELVGVTDTAWNVVALTYKVKDSAAVGAELTVSVAVEELYDGNTDDLAYTVGSATAKIPCTDHKWDAGVETKAATCTEEGEKTLTCTVCGATKTEAIAATGHSYASEVTKEATCTEEGVKTFTCSKCDDTYTESIAKIDHTAAAEKDGVAEATCTEDGYTGDTVCSECDAVLEKGETIPATGHKKADGDKGTIKTPATGKKAGVKVFDCAVCLEVGAIEETFEIGMQIEYADIDDSILAQAGVASLDELKTMMKPTGSTTYTNMQVFEVTLVVDRGDGNLVLATEEDDFPLTITLPYPNDITASNYTKYEFAVTHLKDDGTVETLQPTATADGLVVTVNSLSPIAISWKDAPVPSSGNGNGTGSTAKGSNVPNTGDNSAIVLWTVMLGVCAMGAVTVVASKKKTSK